MKVLLFNPSSLRSTYVEYTRARIPYGLLYVATMLDKEHDVTILDRNTNPSKIAFVLAKEKPDVIGISVMTGKTILDAVIIAQISKMVNPDISVVFGGYHPTLMPQQTIRESFVDYVVVGEGEYTMLELVNHLEQHKDVSKVNGLYYKEGETIKHTKPRMPIKNLDTLPLPAWHKLDMERYITTSIFNERGTTLNTSRGCPFNCFFCCEPAFHKRYWRANSAERVLEMVQHLKAKYHISRIVFRESLFVADLNRLEAICDLFIKHKINITWKCPARIQNWNVHLLRKMRKAGCTALEFGVETGSPRLQKLINKNLSMKVVYDTFHKCNQVGIKPQINLIIGFPTETLNETNMTLDLLKKLKHSHVAINIFTPYPKTVLANHVSHKPSSLREWGTLHEDMIRKAMAFGKVSRRLLWKKIIQIRKLNTKIRRRHVIERLLHHPFDIVPFIITLLRRMKS